VTDDIGNFVFGTFRCDEQERILYRGAEPVPLPPKAMATLLALLRSAPRLVEKDELLKQVWPETFVEEGNLTHNISLLRKALGDDRNGSGMIETVPRRGYRFIAPLEAACSAAAKALAVPPTVEETRVGFGGALHRWSKVIVAAAVGLVLLTLALWLLIASGSVRRHGSGGTRNPAAYQEYLNGRLYYTKHDPDSLRRSVAAFERAIELDRGYAAAYAALAEAYMVLGEHESSNSAYERTKAAATTALKLDPHLPQAHAVLALGEGMLGWHWAEAERGFHRALELDPNYTQAHVWYGILLLRQGRVTEAEQEARRGLASEPFHEVIPWLFASIYYNDRKYDKALEWIQKADTAGTRFGSLPLLHALILVQQQHCPQALETLKQVPAETREQLGPHGYVLARCGRVAEALEIEQRLRDIAEVDGATTAYFLAMVDIGLERNQDALHNLELAYEGRTGYLTRIKMDPVFDPLRPEARLQRIIEEMGLAEPRQPGARN
jgi:DNA-binding winged helix-turn-helix (wHTH) protein/Tfp pilus assembly protein PilF